MGVERRLVVEGGPSQAAVAFPVEPVALRDLAQRAGLGFADVVALADIPSTTLNRLWKDPDWTTRSTGTALQQLVDVVPVLSTYLEGRGFTSRVEHCLRIIEAAGIVVRLPQRVDRAQLAALSNALGVAAAIASGRTADLTRRLSLGWSLGHDQFIDAVFATGPDSLFSDDGSMLAGVSGMWLAAPRATSVSDMVGNGVLAHKTAKYGAAEKDLSPDSPQDIRDIRSAFVRRSLTIGGMLRDGDLEIVKRYQREVETNPVVARNESWSLLTFGSGQRLPVDFSLPTVTPRVYAGVVRDVATLNDAYLLYLVTTALPTLWAATGLPPASLRRRLATALDDRLFSGVADRRLRGEVFALLRALED
ncbi:hypothetical protein ERC79_21415 [Rhodococcus sp. ABRD24]|uniref:hypothetical protein n=1 Tax=Rhodococcus sp. ABRD24 TaxID=2507582 RepID=UPI00103B23A4|nr:hypothetical protein [Rhodococcus sp. ABRD24]QBJ98214.1 hypothetical protein ERC79_21415 [Rhodococcus sp. ABRD24]